ncbi:MAG: aldo/keto reductase [Desulfacinum sp.]|nr:aldo/keto reductase [Desulfacinum sp.]
MKKDGVTRRTFVKAACLGLGTAAAPLATSQTAAGAPPEPQGKVPTRPFGKSGIRVPILSLGGMFDTGANQILLRQAVRWGVTYWDTADCYGGGRSEEGIGRFFSRFPDARKEIFLVTKSDSRDPKGMTRLLERSLERMQTDVIDLYFLHALRSVDELDDDVRRWADAAKASGKIRLFGFSTHSNMARCLSDAARLGWVDGIMFTYNFRLMNDPDLNRALDACTKAGIGLTAMKTQGGGPLRMESGEEAELAERLLRRGFTDKQAKLKIVWEDERIASICSQMPNMTILMSNTAAALDRVSLTRTERDLLRRHARATAHTYCAGCASLCEEATGGPVADLMRCLMYHRDYGDMEAARDAARTLLARGPLPTPPVHRLLAAEQRCPQGLPLRRLFHDAHRLVSQLAGEKKG